MAAFERVFDIWQAARVDGGLPQRGLFPLEDVEGLVGSIVLLKRTDPDHAYYMISGSSVNDRVGWDMTNSNFYDTLDETVRYFTKDWINAALDAPCIAASSFSVEYEQSGLVRVIDAIFCPLADCDDTAESLLAIYRPRETVEPASHGGGFIRTGRKRLICMAVDIGFGVPSLANVPKEHVADSNGPDLDVLSSISESLQKKLSVATRQMTS